MKLDRKMRRRIFARSHFLQAVWDYRHMQGVGFAFSLSPLLRRLYPHAEQRTRALRRHLEFFNTQPYMAGIALGVAANQEEVLVREPSPAREARVAQMKRSLGSSLAAVGDPLFWGAWRPFCAATAAVSLLVSRDPHVLVMIVAGSVILYNILVSAWRWNGIRWGYEDGEQVAIRLSGMRLQRRLKELRWAGFALAALGGAALFLAPPAWLPGSATAKLAAFGASLLMKRAGLPAIYAYAVLFTLATALSLI